MRLTALAILLVAVLRLSAPMYRYNLNRQALCRGLGIAHLLPAFASVPDPDLPVILAICKVESNFDSLAVSSTGDYGIMQVNRRYHPEIAQKWHSPAFNIRIGYKIYLDHLTRSKSLKTALSRYNGDRSGRYARKVLNELYRMRIVYEQLLFQSSHR